ncbi:MAG: hypothetical protein JWM76_4299 [Pseudonocardiales bacterium]|nr:hypothetical protein [Pseudonocardiales bacterium]
MPTDQPSSEVMQVEVMQVAVMQKAHVALETVHAAVYFAAEPRDAYAAHDLHGRSGYFASRGAAFGAVEPAVLVATFAVFAPDFVEEKMAGAWEKISPSALVEVRRTAISATLARVLGDLDVSDVLELARTATEALTPNGRPVYAAHAALSWPDEPRLALWHAATLLREYRGDGHMAAMTALGIHPLDAVILHGVANQTMPFMRETRGWGERRWETAVTDLHVRGWLAIEDGRDVLTDAGRAAKDELEQRTRDAGQAPWRHLGVEATTRLTEAMAPITRRLHDSDVFPVGSPLKPKG